MATGVAPLTYSWFQNGSLVTPAIGSSFNASAPGEYRVEVHDANRRSAWSRTALLTVNAAVAPVALFSPADGATVSGSAIARASAPGATKVEFWLDGERRYTDSTSPFNWAWNTAVETNGPHGLFIKAYSGVTLLGATNPRAVTVDNPPASPCGDLEPNGVKAHEGSDLWFRDSREIWDLTSTFTFNNCFTTAAFAFVIVRLFQAAARSVYPPGLTAMRTCQQLPCRGPTASLLPSFTRTPLEVGAPVCRGVRMIRESRSAAVADRKY